MTPRLPSGIYVSIPHRQATNVNVTAVYWFRFYFVSIPHRQATNTRLRLDCSRYKKFQFLIGRLQTKPLSSSFWNELFVSIPHRQATNKYEEMIFSDIYWVSIPHRQATNAATGSVSRSSPVFQFLIGRLQTHKSPRLQGLVLPVSIPHRQATNHPRLPLG